jgi:hypothetical protein
VHVTGRIIAVQEQRFRLLTDTGQVYLLTLASDTVPDASTLGELQRRGAHLAVRFEGEPNLAGGTALEIREDGRA